MITFKELLSKLLETETKPPGPTGKSKMTKASNKLKKVNTKVNLDQFKRAGAFLFLSKFFLPTITKFRPEADKDRFERMIEFYRSEYNKEFQSILEDGVEYDSDAGGTISVNEKEPLHGSRRLTR